MRYCRFPNCRSKRIDGESYCSKHLKYKPKPFAGAVRSNQSLYHDPRWPQLRKLILEKFGWKCAKCDETKRLEVHHVIAPRGNEELFFDEANLEPLCRMHHRPETNKEIRNRAGWA